jgi:NitT/TauT family transport system ATP-binding protein
MKPEHSLDSQAYVRVNDVIKSYNRLTSELVLGPLNLEIAAQEIVSVIGPRGCGKTTLLKMIAGLTPITGGEILLTGKRVDRPQIEIGFTFQNPVLLDWRTALENTMLRGELHGYDKENREKRARELLVSMGLAGREHIRPPELSPGMRQRLSICQALFHDPALVLMDEPFESLDSMTREQFALDLQRILMARRRTVAIATHSFSEAVQLSDRVIVLTSRPGRMAQTLSIDLPRPRRMDQATTPLIAEYSNSIRMIIQAHRTREGAERE